MSAPTGSVVKIDNELKNALVIEIADKVEQRLSAHEDKKFRTLYALIALVSFIGMGGDNSIY